MDKGSIFLFGEKVIKILLDKYDREGECCFGKNSFEGRNKKGPYGPDGFAIHLRMAGSIIR